VITTSYLILLCVGGGGKSRITRDKTVWAGFNHRLKDIKH